MKNEKGSSRRTLLLGGVAAGLLAILLIWRPWQQRPLIAPPMLTPAEVAGLSDDVLVNRVFHDLLFVLVAPYEDPQAWKRLTPMGRQVFLLAYADAFLRRDSILDQCVRNLRMGHDVALADIADAYATVGAAQIAEVLRAADAVAKAHPDAIEASLDRRWKNAGTDPVRDETFAAVQQRLRPVLAAAPIVKPCAAYIRAHAAEILVR